MNIYNKFKKYTPTKVYKRNNIDCYLDSCRKKLIPVTPEETIRQQMIQFLIKELDVPQSMIDTEVILKKYGINSNERIDIVINERVADNLLESIALIECKSNITPLTTRVFEQAVKYADKCEINYIFISNGIEINAFHYNENEERYIPLLTLPTYNQMIHNGISQPDYVQEWNFERLHFDELSDIKSLDNNDMFYMLGEDTPDCLKPFIINLGECLLDTSHTLSQKDYGYFKLIEDYGVRYMSYGNASGGTWESFYRTFIIEDSHKNTQMISLSIIQSVKGINRSGKSCLMVAIDDFDKSHHSLQLNLNKFLTQHKNEFNIVHNGAISIGNIGSGKISELIKLIKNECPELLDSHEKIHLGKIKTSKLMYIDDDDIENLIINLIKYAIIRDNYRKHEKS